MPRPARSRQRVFLRATRDSCGGLLREERIIRVTFFRAAVKRRAVVGIEQRIFREAFHQIGIGDELAALGDGIGFATLHRFRSAGQSVAAVGNQFRVASD